MKKEDLIIDLGQNLIFNGDNTSRNEETLPEIYVEEIDADPPCCVLNLTAVLRPYNNNDTFQLVQGGPLYSKAIGRTIDFKITMKDQNSARKVKVIQYWKNERYTVRNGAKVITFKKKLAPNPDPGWQWIPGNDGWIVDSVDKNRCYDEKGTTRNKNTVVWTDTPTLALIGLQNILNARTQYFKPDDVANGGDFPHNITTLFKTDIFCSDKDVCSEAIAKNQETPIASVSWRQNYTIRTNRVNNPRFPLGWGITGLASEVLIDNIVPTVNNWCPSLQVTPF